MEILKRSKLNPNPEWFGSLINEISKRLFIESTILCGTSAMKCSLERRLLDNVIFGGLIGARIVLYNLTNKCV